MSDIIDLSGRRIGGSKSCGCLRKEKASPAVSKDLTGQTFEQLKVFFRLENAGKSA